jgi:hypothetical protein
MFSVSVVVADPIGAAANEGWGVDSGCISF